MITDTNLHITNELTQATLGAECKQTKSSKSSTKEFSLSDTNLAEVHLIKHFYTTDVFGAVIYNSTVMYFGKKVSTPHFDIEEYKDAPRKYKFITDTIKSDEPTAVWAGITINIVKSVKPYKNKYKSSIPDFGVVYKPNVELQSLIKSTCPESHVLPTDTEELMKPQYWIQQFNRPVKYKDGVDITETKYFTPESYLINTYNFKKFYQKKFLDAIVSLKECSTLAYIQKVGDPGRIQSEYMKRMRKLGQTIAIPAVILACNIWWSHDSSVMYDFVTWSLRAADVLRDALVPDSYHARRDDVQHEIEQAIKAILNGGIEKVLKYRLRDQCCYKFPEGYTEEQKAEFKKLYPKVKKYNRTPYNTSKKHLQVMELWFKGVKESEIAKEMGIRTDRVKHIVWQAKKENHPEVQEKESTRRRIDECIIEWVTEGKMTRNEIAAKISEHAGYKINTKYIQRLMKKPWVIEYLKQEEEQKERDKALNAGLMHTEAMRERVDSNGTCDLREFTENNVSGKYDVGFVGA